MKKVLFLAFAAVMTSVAVSSCSHDDGYNVPTVIQPSEQKDTIEQFIAENGYTDLTQDTAVGSDGLMSHVINPGNLNRKFYDSIPVVYFKVNGTFLNGTSFYTTGSTDLAFNFLTGAASSQDAYYLARSGVVSHYLLTLGEGGSVTCVSPSLYTYANNPITLSTGTIPANTPLYYSSIVIDSIRSK